MQRVACDRLLDLPQQDVVVAHDEVADCRALPGSRVKVRGRDPRRRPRQLHDRAGDRRLCSQRGARANDSPTPDGCRFDRRAALHDRDQRHHTGMWEINVLDLLADVLQHYAALEGERAQVRRQQGKIMRRQCRQETVESSVLELPGNRGGAIRHRRVTPHHARRAKSGYMKLPSTNDLLLQ